MFLVISWVDRKRRCRRTTPWEKRRTRTTCESRSLILSVCAILRKPSGGVRSTKNASTAVFSANFIKKIISLLEALAWIIKLKDWTSCTTQTPFFLKSPSLNQFLATVFLCKSFSFLAPLKRGVSVNKEAFFGLLHNCFLVIIFSLAIARKEAPKMKFLSSRTSPFAVLISLQFWHEVKHQ